MKTLLCATLAALLVAAVTAQSSQQSDNPASIQEFIDKLNHVVSSLGGFEGIVNKLENITKLVEETHTDRGIRGWFVGKLIKLELDQLKEKAISTEKDVINHLLEKLETEAGLTTYSADSAENYILNESVTNAITFIRQSIQQILAEISKAQKEHDEAAGNISKDVLNKINERLTGLKEKLRGLSKKLLDKLTGRDKTAEVYGADGGIRYFNTQLSGRNYIFNDMIKDAAKQIRERIFKYVELIRELKREAQEAFGQHKVEALEHLERLRERLRQSMAELKDTLLGRKTNDELKKETEEKVDDSYTIQSMSSENYILEGVLKELVGKLREKIAEVIAKIRKATREAERAAKEGKEVALDNLAKLREQLKILTKDLKDAILGQKTKKELEKDLEE